MATAEERIITPPPVNPENERYFDPRVVCPHCFSDQTEWVPAKGTGTVYSYSTMRRGVPAPYTIAYVTLDEGVSMMTNIVDCDVDTLGVGDKVQVVFRSAEDGTPVPMFTSAVA